ncbi:ferredoxin [Shimia biformata]|uniref:ferredoxin n=1 Tax=Shimia biformata TaxID=1294299 RepID=UPI0019500AB5|nr:ferredoxin [Shimia biformata]
MTPDLPLIERLAATWHLEVLGGFHPDNGEEHLSGIGTLLMFGPREPGFWGYFTTQPEWDEDMPNPMDRWSVRALASMGAALGAAPFYPFDGPPWMPFVSWALRTRRCHPSPVSLLVHDRAGLFVSFRGALGLPQRIALPAPPASPCDSCSTQPCRSACPVGALRSDGYDVSTCKADIVTSVAHPCRTRGCAVRRACPASARYGRQERHSAYHMEQFLENGT